MEVSREIYLKKSLRTYQDNAIWSGHEPKGAIYLFLIGDEIYFVIS